MVNALNFQQQNSLSSLNQEVLETDACTACGNCVSLCSNIFNIGDRIAPVADCQVETSRCYHFCPRTTPFPRASAELAGDIDYKGPVGAYEEFYMARRINSSEEYEGSFQYGGVVSTLMAKALEQGTVNRAVVTRSYNDFPYAETVLLPHDVLSSGGSKFALSPTNIEVNRAVRDSHASLGVVGLPCQCTGLKKRQLYPSEEGQEGMVSLVIGLFCTWALTQAGWKELLNNLGESGIKRMDLPPPPAEVMEITSSNGKHEISLDKVKQYVRPGCDVCLDMTAENADISVGMVEGLPEYNTVIIRSENAKALFLQAVEEGELEANNLGESSWKHLCEASLNKKKRSINNAQKRESNLPYYNKLGQLKERIENW